MLINVVIGIVAMLILALGLILFVVMYQRRVISYQLELKKISKQQELELIQASIESEEHERGRIASELHDDVSTTLASARLFLHKTNDTFKEEDIAQSKELLDTSIARIREISHKLQPATLQHLGLQSALQSILDLLDRSGEVITTYISDVSLPRLTDKVELAVYRICQELMNNIIKHAKPASLKLEVTLANEIICMTFIHDGDGITNAQFEDGVYKQGANGLKNILNRLKLIDGSLNFYKESGHYRAELSIPIA